MISATANARFNWPRRLAACFVASAGAILLGTGGAKVLSALGSAEMLVLDDPVFSITFRHLLLMVATVEIAVGCTCFFQRLRRVAPALVAWTATNFLLYRVELALVGWHRPCHCLGSLTDVLHMSPRTADLVATALMIYLLVGGFIVVWWLRGTARQRALEQTWPRGTGGASGFCVSLIVGGCLAAANLRAFEFEALGTIEKAAGQSPHSPSGRGRKPAPNSLTLSDSGFDFQVHVRDAKWRIDLGPNATTGQQGLFEISAGSDGVDTFVVTRFSNALKRRLVESQLPRLGAAVAYPGGADVAQILPGPALFEFPGAAVVWLAFCSGDYLGAVGTNKIVPIHLAMPPGAVLPQFFLCRASWETLSPNPGVPRILRYFEDEIVHVGRGGQVQRLRLDPPFDKGYVSALYNVIAATNSGGYRLPLRFTFQIFVPKYPDARDASDTIPTSSWHGTVTRLSSAVPMRNAEFVPVLHGNTPIADRRFAANSAPLVGYVTNQWPSRDGVLASPGIGTWKKIGTLLPNRGRPKRTGPLFPITFLCASVGFAFFLWRYLVAAPRAGKKNETSRMEW